jgi:hypothetical protein
MSVSKFYFGSPALVPIAARWNKKKKDGVVEGYRA